MDNQRRTFGAHAQIDRFYDINECFILLVLHIRTTPTRIAGCLARNFRRFFLLKVRIGY